MATRDGWLFSILCRIFRPLANFLRLDGQSPLKGESTQFSAKFLLLVGEVLGVRKSVFRHEVKFFGELLHVVSGLAVDDFGVNLGREDVRVSEHLGDGLDGHSVVEGDCRCEGVTGCVESHVLVYATEGCNLLQVVVALLVGRNREEELRAFLLAKGLVLVDEPQRNVQQRNVDGDFRLGALCHNPHRAIGLLLDVFGGELLDVDVGHPCVAAEQENVSHLLEALGCEFPFGQFVEFLDRQVATLHLVLLQVLKVEGVTRDPAVVPCHLVHR